MIWTVDKLFNRAKKCSQWHNIFQHDFITTTLYIFSYLIDLWSWLGHRKQLSSGKQLVHFSCINSYKLIDTYNNTELFYWCSPYTCPRPIKTSQTTNDIPDHMDYINVPGQKWYPGPYGPYKYPRLGMISQTTDNI